MGRRGSGAGYAIAIGRWPWGSGAGGVITLPRYGCGAGGLRNGARGGHAQVTALRPPGVRGAWGLGAGAVRGDARPGSRRYRYRRDRWIVV